MLITVGQDRADNLLKQLIGQGIPAAIIGEMTEAKDILIQKGDKFHPVDPPQTDELYKVVD